MKRNNNNNNSQGKNNGGRRSRRRDAIVISRKTLAPVSARSDFSRVNGEYKDVSISRSEYLGDLSNAAGPLTRGSVLYEVVLGPHNTTSPLTAFESQCALYQEYRFDSMQVNITFATPTTVSGALLVWQEDDPCFSASNMDADSLVRRGMATPGAKTFSIYGGQQIQLRPPNRNVFRFTSAKAESGASDAVRQESFGKLFVVAATLVPQATLSGTVEFQWRATFRKPTLPTSMTSSSFRRVFASAVKEAAQTLTETAAQSITDTIFSKVTSTGARIAAYLGSIYFGEQTGRAGPSSDQPAGMLIRSSRANSVSSLVFAPGRWDIELTMRCTSPGYGPLQAAGQTVPLIPDLPYVDFDSNFPPGSVIHYIQYTEYSPSGIVPTIVDDEAFMFGEWAAGPHVIACRFVVELTDTWEATPRFYGSSAQWAALNNSTISGISYALRTNWVPASELSKRPSGFQVTTPYILALPAEPVTDYNPVSVIEDYVDVKKEEEKRNVNTSVRLPEVKTPETRRVPKPS